MYICIYHSIAQYLTPNQIAVLQKIVNFFCINRWIMVHSEKNNFWSFLTFRGGGPDQGSENSELFFFRMNPSLTLDSFSKIWITCLLPLLKKFLRAIMVRFPRDINCAKSKYDIRKFENNFSDQFLGNIFSYLNFKNLGKGCL